MWPKLILIMRIDVGSRKLTWPTIVKLLSVIYAVNMLQFVDLTWLYKQCPGTFLDIIGQNAIISKFNWSHVVIFSQFFSLLIWGIIYRLL